MTKTKTNITYIPGLRVGIYNWNDGVKSIRLVTLVTWVCGLKTELKGFPVTRQPILPLARQFLETPPGIPAAEILQHLQDSYENIKEQLRSQS